MNKALRYGIIAFFTFLAISIIVYCISSINKSNQIEESALVDNTEIAVAVDIEKAIGEGKWYDITEEDRITLAMGTETDIISNTIKYLKENKIAIFFVYGGPFDSKLKGNYII